MVEPGCCNINNNSTQPPPPTTKTNQTMVLVLAVNCDIVGVYEDETQMRIGIKNYVFTHHTEGHQAAVDCIAEIMEAFKNEDNDERSFVIECLIAAITCTRIQVTPKAST